MRRAWTITPGRTAPSVLLALLGLGLLATGCASSDPSSTSTYVAAGQIPKADLPTGLRNVGAHAASVTVPLAKQNPTTAFFSAVAIFQSCLTGRGVTFVGAPNPKDPSSPANDPNYLKALVACAAQSKILQALKSEQSAQDNLTPAQVKKENQQYLGWRKCMIARGWGIPTPTPNSKGLLFSFGGTGGGGGGGGGATGGITPPPGESLFSSPDLQACAAKVQGQSS